VLKTTSNTLVCWRFPQLRPNASSTGLVGGAFAILVGKVEYPLKG
jgi:hypothetical protein